MRMTQSISANLMKKVITVGQHQRTLRNREPGIAFHYGARGRLKVIANRGYPCQCHYSIPVVKGNLRAMHGVEQ